jgi:hypothetical protein
MNVYSFENANLTYGQITENITFVFVGAFLELLKSRSEIIIFFRTYRVYNRLCK